MLIGTAAALAACYALATEAILLGSPRGRWHYRYVQPLTFKPFLIALAAAVPAVLLLRVRPPRTQAGQWLLVAAWIALATAVHAALRSLTLFSFERIFASPGANSFYTATLQQPLSAVLAEFAQLRGALPLHAQSNMPGKLVLLYGLERFTVDPLALAWLVVVLSNLGALLMFRFVLRVFDDATVAVYAAILYLFVPAKLFFFPLMNTATPVVALAFACLVAEWLGTARSRWAAATGAMLYVVVFFEPLPLVLGLLFAALALRAVFRGDLTWTQLLSQAALALLVFLAVGVAVYQLWGFNLAAGFQAVRAHAMEFNAIERRPYEIWVRANLVEFFVGMGVCQAVLIGGALALGLTGPGAWRDRLARPITVTAMALVLVVAATDLIGINRGEVIRLWIFLACFLQIPAAYVSARAGGTAITLVLLTTLLLSALGTANIGFVVPE